MLKWAKRIIKKTARKIAADGGKRSRWSDSTETTRLTSAQWVNATDTLINTDLESSLDTLRTRATYEASCNAYIDGMIGTHQTSILGPNGPTLDVQSDSKAYNEALKAAWGEWWEMPDRGRTAHRSRYSAALAPWPARQRGVSGPKSSHILRQPRDARPDCTS